MKQGRQNLEVRSVLLSAGSRSLNNGMNIKKQTKVKPTYPHKEIDKKLIIKLTLPRLRKMQALVRGFITRRKVYPILLQQYLLAKTVLNSVVSNVVYRQSSEVIMEQLTYLKYEPDSQQAMEGIQSKIQKEICNSIIESVLKKQLKFVIEGAVIEHSKLLSRPKITYGFNLRDPLQLLLFDSLNNFVRKNLDGIVQESIQQCAQETRQLMVISQWIDKYQMLRPLYEQIIEESLTESIGEYIVDNMLNRLSTQAGQVVGQLAYHEEIKLQQERAQQEICEKVIQFMLQQSITESILQVKHSIER